MHIDLTLTANTYQYHVIGILNKRIVAILIDTGASWSHVSKEYCDNIQTLLKPRTIQRFDGTEKLLSQFSNVLFNIPGMETFQMKIIIDEEPNKVLLGIDFLENFKYHITSDFLMLNGIRIDRYKLSEEILRTLI